MTSFINNPLIVSFLILAISSLIGWFVLERPKQLLSQWLDIIINYILIVIGLNAILLLFSHQFSLFKLLMVHPWASSLGLIILIGVSLITKVRLNQPLVLLISLSLVSSHFLTTITYQSLPYFYLLILTSLYSILLVYKPTQYLKTFLLFLIVHTLLSPDDMWLFNWIILKPTQIVLVMIASSYLAFRKDITL